MTTRSWGAPLAARLPDGRLHLQHGPIDLVIAAEDVAEAAYRAAIARFGDILATLVAELPALRTPVADDTPDVAGPVARRMLAACRPHRSAFITPMAAVAGAVADEVLAAMVAAVPLRRASVNNGGDIALHLAPGEQFRIGLAGIEDAALHGTLTLRSADAPRGVATSGWRGRSQSLGIADAVTVIATNAAAADAAATLVANAVSVDHPAVRRRPACEVRDDSDLGDRLVTVAVGTLPEDLVHAALDRGVAAARRMRDLGLIHAACLRLQGAIRVVGIDGNTLATLPGDPRP
jgi:hypothetical protein